MAMRAASPLPGAGPAPGLKIEEYLWTFNMPTDHPRVSFTDVWVPDDALLGAVDRGLAMAQHFVHENRIRQAASRWARPTTAWRRASITRARASRSARTGREPGHPVSVGRAGHAGRDARAS